MKNRAKCKLCSSIIESFHEKDYVECSCGTISIWGGPGNYNLSYDDINNFLRIDDEGNEIVVTVKDKEDVKPLDNEVKPSKKELIQMLDEMANNIENLPAHAKFQPVNQYDLQALITLLSLILKS
jgi:HKD family nuclease